MQVTYRLAYNTIASSTIIPPKKNTVQDLRLWPSFWRSSDSGRNPLHPRNMRHLPVWPNVHQQGWWNPAAEKISVRKVEGAQKNLEPKKTTRHHPPVLLEKPKMSSCVCVLIGFCLFFVCWPRDIAPTSLASHVSWNENWTKKNRVSTLRISGPKNATMDLPCCKVTSYLYGVQLLPPKKKWLEDKLFLWGR